MNAARVDGNGGLTELLARSHLDVIYTSGSGSYLQTDAGTTVLDLAQGAGSGLLGHNHPEIVEVVAKSLAEKVPHHAQLSSRPASRALIEQLSTLMTGRPDDYKGILVNTGTEANEAAIKHAVLEFRFRLNALLEESEAALERLHRDHLRGRPIVFPEHPLNGLALGNGKPCGSIDNLRRNIEGHHARLRAAPPRLIAFEGSFHGKTSGALSATWNPRYRQPFELAAGNVLFVPPGDLEALKAAMQDDSRTTYSVGVDPHGRLTLKTRSVSGVAALLVEIVQGEGGIHPVPDEFLKAARILCRENDVPFVADEIQTFGRTGRLLASEALDLSPDYVTLAKGLGGGVCKIGAALFASRRYCSEFDLLHTSTFAGDEMSSRVALKTCEILCREERSLLLRAAQVGAELKEQLAAVQARFPRVIQAVRGLGLMIGIEFRPLETSPSSTIRSVVHTTGAASLGVAAYLLHEERIRVLPTLSDPNTIRVEPSLLFERHEADRFVRAIERLAETLDKANAYRFVRHFIGSRDRPDEAIRNFRPVADARAQPTDCPKKAAFLCHLVAAEDVWRLDPSLAEFGSLDTNRLIRKFERIAEPDLLARFRVRSGTGDAVELSFILLPFVSEQFTRWMEAGDLELARARIEQAARIADRLGCSVMGLGQYTSIITNNGRSLSSSPIRLTTGNAFTAGTAIEALCDAASQHDISVEGASVAIIGAGGNIGSVVAEILSTRCARLRLIGGGHWDSRMKLCRTAARICANRPATFDGASSNCVAARLADCGLPGPAAADQWESITFWDQFESKLRTLHGDSAPISLESSLSEVADCQLVISAANASEPVLFPRHLNGRKVVVCDIGVPANVHPSVAASPAVELLRGGTVRLPGGEVVNVLGPDVAGGAVFACIAETMLLALEEYPGHFSHGPITAQQVVEIQQMAARHGFTLNRMGALQTV